MAPHKVLMVIILKSYVGVKLCYKCKAKGKTKPASWKLTLGRDKPEYWCDDCLRPLWEVPPP